MFKLSYFFFTCKHSLVLTPSTPLQWGWIPQSCALINQVQLQQAWLDPLTLTHSLLLGHCLPNVAGSDWNMHSTPARPSGSLGVTAIPTENPEQLLSKQGVWSPVSLQKIISHRDLWSCQLNASNETSPLHPHLPPVSSSGHWWWSWNVKTRF